MRIGIIVGSTRPARRGDQVARWVERGAARPDVEFEIVDLVDYDLPLLDEPVPAAVGGYSRPHTRRWSQKIDSLDGFVFVVPEYNHSLPAAAKNAIDFLFTEWNDKAAAVVSYGTAGGGRAAEHLRLVLAEVKTATVRSQVLLSLFDDFELENPTQVGTFTPREHQGMQLERMLGELLQWSGALRTLRDPSLPTRAW